MLRRRVDLPSGGYLMIDYAEAMTVIDVNSGSFTGRGKGAKLEDTITKTNLESAEEVVRQLRLRDIGGIIVIDFIDMARARNRDTVLKTLRKSLDEDRTKTYVVEISPLGLVEMTRQNVTDGVREIMTKPCPDLRGRGRGALGGDGGDRGGPLAARPRGREAEGAGLPDPGAPEGGVDPGRRPRRRGADLEIEQETGKHFHFEGTEALPIDHFEVVLEGTPDEIEERALPFREGEEVLVLIEEPHMYNEDDAVAKLDGYVISVFGRGDAGGREDARPDREGGPERREATLVNPPEGVSLIARLGERGRGLRLGDGSPNGRRRRRGRRGGRGRRKQAGTGSSSA